MQTIFQQKTQGLTVWFAPKRGGKFLTFHTNHKLNWNHTGFGFVGVDHFFFFFFLCGEVSPHIPLDSLVLRRKFRKLPTSQSVAISSTLTQKSLETMSGSADHMQRKLQDAVDTMLEQLDKEKIRPLQVINVRFISLLPTHYFLMLSLLLRYFPVFHSYRRTYSYIPKPIS